MARKKRSAKHGTKQRRAGGGEPSPADSDYLLDAAEKNWSYILMMYKQFESKKPVMLFDIQEQRIYVYPYADFLADLSERSRLMLKDQYERAILENKIVV